MTRRTVQEGHREGARAWLTLSVGCAMLAIVALFGGVCLLAGVLSVLELGVQSLLG